MNLSQLRSRGVFNIVAPDTLRRLGAGRGVGRQCPARVQQIGEHLGIARLLMSP
eukprot:COSAG01_NODE_229_length_21089_cov_575.019194_28_plen_54_part_00